jgi:hypothetical protein
LKNKGSPKIPIPESLSRVLTVRVGEDHQLQITHNPRQVPLDGAPNRLGQGVWYGPESGSGDVRAAVTGRREQRRRGGTDGGFCFAEGGVRGGRLDWMKGEDETGMEAWIGLGGLAGRTMVGPDWMLALIRFLISSISDWEEGWSGTVLMWECDIFDRTAGMRRLRSAVERGGGGGRALSKKYKEKRKKREVAAGAKPRTKKKAFN